MSFLSSINLSSLNGTNGFRLDGAAANAGSGARVSSAGDVNGDGLADIIIGCFGPNSYVVFGQAGGFASSINLAGLDGSNGFRVAAGGPSVASAGDVNGDGLDDVIIGDTSDAGRAGASYVVFGKASGFASAIAPSNLDGNNGFQLVGVAPFDLAGGSVASAGDVNGDGFADLIIGASGAYRQTGASYVVFGKAGGFASSINLASLDGTNGFQLVGVAEFDSAGGSVASAGDVNGDGFADLIIGASGTFEQASPSPSYLVFGKASGFDPSIDLSSLDGSSGFRLDGVAPYDYSGFSVASAGDVNGDGYSDLIIGAYGADPRGTNMAGSSYIVFGKPGGSASSINLGDLNGTTGFRLDGVAADDYSGFSVAAAGDVNGDGFADLIISAYLADPNGTNSGSSYLLFGKASGFASSINLGDLNGTTGFRLDGVSRLDWSGYSVASAGDVTGDGLPDLIIGAPEADPNGSASGSSYIYFSPATGGATYRGTTLADNLRGTAFGDIMNGYASNDSINGGAGNDTIAGGAGNDTIDSGDGDDTVQWTLGDGNDTITLGSGTNFIDFGDNPYTYTDSGAQRVFTIGSATVTVTVTVNDWTTGSNSVVINNHAPAVTSGSAATFAENDTGTVYTAIGTDPDANTTLTWSLGGTDAAFFEINPASGQVTFKNVPNFENPADTGADNVYDITVTASDGSLSSTAQAVAITVMQIFYGVSTPSIPDLIATDDKGIFNTDNVTSKTITIFIGTGTPGDVIHLYDAYPTTIGSTTVDAFGNWSITVTLSPGTHYVSSESQNIIYNVWSGPSYPLTVTIDNSAPALAVPISISSNVLLLGQTAIVTFTFTEAVSGFDTDDVMVSNGILSGLSTGDSGVTWTATLTPSSGVMAAANMLVLNNTGYTDLAGNPGVSTSVSGNYSVATIQPDLDSAITVTSRNAAPSITSGDTASFAENATGTVYTAIGTDPDAGTNLTYALGGTDADLFNINTAAGAVTFKAAPNFEAPADAGHNNVYDITVTASDGSLSSTPKALAITVTDIPEFFVKQGSNPWADILAAAYNGPVPGLMSRLPIFGDQALDIRGNDIVIGTYLSDFINTGAGEDAIDAGAGNDLLDAGPGSNFLTGGAGTDDFFLDGRSAATAITWSTITDFQAGEYLTIWGYQPGVSTFNWVTSAGAAGYQGATLHYDLDGNGSIDTSVTFSALTQVQTRMLSYGSIEGADYILFG